ncbi:hypothetical protein FSP39_004651 [Pinctada imbricata]|uniref:Uncharacterized protein n=1 Tax=Pinctada imbricata TaxID=66713 RepID=A0AA88XCH2_PINIB|nr:hypothetical protein FSP39_004651 [Pinctada imbricata]
MGLALGIYFGGGVSGGYVNPAITLGFCLSGRIPWKKFPVFVPAQFLGAFTAAAINYGLYLDAINHYDNGTRSTTGPNSTAGIFVTFPQEFVSTTTAYFDEVFCTFILVGASLAITDPRNMLPNNGFLPVALGSVVFAIGTSFGFNSGYAINPARDLSPRIFIALAGWGTEPFTFRNYYFWVPVIGPMTGGFVASLLYSLLIEIHWPEEEPEKEEDVIEKPIVNEISNGQANKTFMKGIFQNLAYTGTPLFCKK